MQPRGFDEQATKGTALPVAAVPFVGGSSISYIDIV